MLFLSSITSASFSQPLNESTWAVPRELAFQKSWGFAKYSLIHSSRKPNDLYAIVALRNEVSHNRFLLDNKNLKKCSAGDGNGSLWTNIINLKNCLPEPIRMQFTIDINDCAKEGKIDYSNQTQWVLIDGLIVKI